MILVIVEFDLVGILTLDQIVKVVVVSAGGLEGGVEVGGNVVVRLVLEGGEYEEQSTQHGEEGSQHPAQQLKTRKCQGNPLVADRIFFKANPQNKNLNQNDNF